MYHNTSKKVSLGGKAWFLTSSVKKVADQQDLVGTGI